LAAAAAVAALAACGGDDRTTVDTTTAAGATTAVTPTPAPDADAVDDRVERALEADSLLRRYGLDADDDDNRVVLKGTVRTDAEKAHAQSVASGLAAGAAIDNRIKVDANARGWDAVVDVDDLEDQIEDAIEADSTFRGHDIDVDEDNGKIVLEGRVPAAVKTAAEALARRMAGTVQVVSRITAG
jgi:osmotically-inducible protein OsmY